MTKIPPFEPAELKPIRQLYAEGKFGPKKKLRTILKKCYAREFPCVRLGNEWHSTDAAVRAWVWDNATPDFRGRTS